METTKLTLDNWMVAWNPCGRAFGGNPPGAIRVDRWPDITGWSDRYLFATSCFIENRGAATPYLKWRRLICNVFDTIVLRDGVDPEDAGRELDKIDTGRARRLEAAAMDDGVQRPKNAP